MTFPSFCNNISKTNFDTGKGRSVYPQGASGIILDFRFVSYCSVFEFKVLTSYLFSVCLFFFLNDIVRSFLVYYIERHLSIFNPLLFVYIRVHLKLDVLFYKIRSYSKVAHCQSLAFYLSGYVSTYKKFLQI